MNNWGTGRLGDPDGPRQSALHSPESGIRVLWNAKRELVFWRWKGESSGSWAESLLLQFGSQHCQICVSLGLLLWILLSRRKWWSGTAGMDWPKGKPCLTDLTAFCDKMTRFVDKGRAVDVTYLDFNNALSSVSHNILVSELGHHSLVVGQLSGLITGWMAGLRG